MTDEARNAALEDIAKQLCVAICKHAEIDAERKRLKIPQEVVYAKITEAYNLGLAVASVPMPELPAYPDDAIPDDLKPSSTSLWENPTKMEKYLDDWWAKKKAEL